VANRGEIALRIIRACHEEGLETVAVFSDADRSAPYVRAADTAVGIGPAPARESYLVAEKILDAAARTGADAIHPGFGFLSERAPFAQAVADAGLVFVGPPASAIAAMGDKTEARRRMQAAGVPVVPGAMAAIEDQAVAEEMAASLGYPVLVKATAGGGGKGMRRVDKESELADALDSARRESKAAFAHDGVIVEKLIRPARHVEIQIFGDAHGNVVALGERECSLQRRHQKIVEESPSPVMTPDLRAKMQEAACAIAREVTYENAATVEFLVSDDGSFYFLEVNTRLQVEHPVTEMVTGLDLVRWQIQVARGEPLPLKQDEITLRGAAIEVRLYAEDPENGFLPSLGELIHVSFPHRPGFRVDTGVETGSVIGGNYDPMLAKLIVHAPDREQAAKRLIEAIDESAVLGLHHNLGYLRALLASELFLSGKTFTHSIDSWVPWYRGELGIPPMALAAAVLGPEQTGSTGGSTHGASAASDPHSPWQRLGNWQMWGSQ
jgi:3-methylcrotonyl-CoA carboxylase alpha subunit